MDNFYNGFIAGSAQTIIGHPFDTIKTRLQSGKKSTTKFYKGFFPPFLSGCLQNSFIFATEQKMLEYYSPFVAGCIAGTLSSVIICPTEYIKCNQQVHSMRWQELVRQNIFRGMSTTLLRDSVGFGIYFSAYHWLQKRNNNPLLNGGVAGVLSWTYSYPIDTVKTRHQTTKESLVDIIKKMDWRGGFRGMKWMLLRAFMVNAGIFWIFENVK